MATFWERAVVVARMVIHSLCNKYIFVIWVFLILVSRAADFDSD